MGRKINEVRKEAVLETIKEHDGQLQSAGVAKELGLHPQEVSRVLASLEDDDDNDTYLYEDDKGFLGIFKWW